MISLRTEIVITVLLTTILAVMAFFDANWMWLVISLLSAVMLVIPVTMDLGYYYHGRIPRLIAYASIATVILIVIRTLFPIETESFLDVTVYTYLSAAVQAYQCFIIGFMLALVMDRSFGMTMTPSWMMIFALGFAMTLSAVDVFFTFIELYLSGYPVFNHDFVDSEVYTNSIIMVMPVVSTIVTTFLALVIGRSVRRHNKNDFIIRRGVEI